MDRPALGRFPPLHLQLRARLLAVRRPGYHAVARTCAITSIRPDDASAASPTGTTNTSTAPKQHRAIGHYACSTTPQQPGPAPLQRSATAQHFSHPGHRHTSPVGPPVAAASINAASAPPAPTQDSVLASHSCSSTPDLPAPTYFELQRRIGRLPLLHHQSRALITGQHHHSSLRPPRRARGSSSSSQGGG